MFLVIVVFFVLGLSSVATYSDEKTEERVRREQFGEGAPGSAGVLEVEALGAQLRALSMKLDDRAQQRVDFEKRITATELALSQIGELEKAVPVARV